MSKLLATLCLLLICNSYVFATAFGAGTAWDVRTTGADTNAGAFDSGVASPGTDASQGAGTAFSDLVLSGSGTTATSTTLAFSATTHGPGNFLIIASGTGCTPGTYEMLSQSAGTGTFNVSMGSAASTCSGVFGGSKLTIGAAVALAVALNSIYIKTGTYTITSAISTSTSISFLGYSSTHNDLNGAAWSVWSAAAPLITTATNSTALFTTTGSDGSTTQYKNLSMSNTAATRAQGILCNEYGAVVAENLIMDGFSIALDGTTDSRFRNLFAFNLEIKNWTVNALSETRTGGVGYIYLSDSWIHDAASGTGPALYFFSGEATIINRTVISGSGGRGILYDQMQNGNYLSLLSRICGLIPVPEGVPTCDKGLFP